MVKVLMIEDDIQLCDGVSLLLKKEGYGVDVCYDGESGLSFARQKAHDVIILDRMIPAIDGLRVLEILRKEAINTPVLFLTALNTTNDKILGLDTGADDYLAKPFEMRELLARIRAVVRRPAHMQLNHLVDFNGNSLNPVEKTVTNGKEVFELTKREADLLELFFKKPYEAIGRQEIIAKVWGPFAEVEDGNLDNYIYFLRKILKQLDPSIRIKTIRAMGFKLEK